MNFKNITIRKLLSLFAICIALLLACIGLLINTSIKSTFHEYEILNSLKEIENLELSIRNSEKEYLVNEIHNLNYHKSGKSESLEEIKQNLKYIHIQLRDLMQSSTIQKLNYERKLESISVLFSNYDGYLEKLSALFVKKGFKDFGLEGEMRSQIHMVEGAINETGNLLYSKYMLTLRRHEKDYLLRNDFAYLEKFNKQVEEFSTEIKKRNIENEKDFVVLLKKYKDTFNEIVSIDEAIGLQSNSGVVKNINESMTQIEQNLDDVKSGVAKLSKAKIRKTVFNLFLILFIASLMIIFATVKISRHIVKSIGNLSSYITRLGHGELPEEIPIYNKDEIASMKQSINELTKNLKNTRDFAEAVGNGQFDKEVDVFGNQGDLGKSLVEMRAKLLQVSNERDIQIKESEMRLWTNEGFNMMHEVIASNSIKDNTFYYNVISRLVKFLNANQGSLFVAGEQNEEVILIQRATFAFDRNRIGNSVIRIGEGLLGAVAYERESTYMTKVPENYINITSGLGDARPRSLLIVPCLADKELMAVIELASFEEMSKVQIDFVKRVALDLGNVLLKIRIEETTQLLLDKTREQTNELCEKEEEMRQNLEELKATQEAMKEKENQLFYRITQLEEENERLRIICGNEKSVLDKTELEKYSYS